MILRLCSQDLDGAGDDFQVSYVVHKRVHQYNASIDSRPRLYLVTFANLTQGSDGNATRHFF